MKIALVIETMDPTHGGRELSTAQVAAGLGGRGHQVTILCQRGKWSCDGVEVRALGTAGMLRVLRLKNFIDAVRREIATSNFDIVHCMLPVPGANVYQPRGGTVPGQRQASLRRRCLAGRAAAMLTEPLNLCRRYMGGLEWRVMHDPSVLCLGVSEMVSQEFTDYYGRSENVRTIYNAVDVPDVDAEQRADWRQQRRFQLGLGQQDLLLLTVAHNFKLKGLARAIEAMAKWRHSTNFPGKARLVVIGRGWPEPFQRHASLREIGREVVFLGEVDDVFPWYSAADACILLSWYDPCSRVLLEATRWGVPSITTLYNGAAEVLARGAGIVVSSPKDTRAVAAAMEELSDPKQRAYRTDACSRCAEELSIARHVEALLDAYARVPGRPQV